MGIAGSNDRGRSGKRHRTRGSSSPRRRTSPTASETTAGNSAAGRKTSSITRRTGNKPMQFNIPSDFMAGREVQDQILQDIEKKGFDSQSVFAVKLALEEALINAIKHGNKLDPAKRVRIEASVTPRQAEITIEDEGPGFDRCCVPDPLLEENLQKCSGRGLLLMEAYMSSVEFSKGGRRVRMIKKKDE